MGKIKKALKDPRAVLAWAFRKTKMYWSDEKYLKILYWLFYGKKLHLNKPEKYSEKIQWLKLYNRKPIFTQMVDKFEVKRIVTEKIGSEYVIPCYGVWDSFDEIDFNQLPDQFCLKCTHDSGSFVICKDKSTFNKVAAKERLERNRNKNFFYEFREWPYKDVKARIIAEKYEPSLGKSNSIEYKLTCCDGEVKVITVCGGVPHADFSLRSNDNFSKDWPYVRVDWYIIGDKPYFGEFTFFTWAGFLRFKPQEWDAKMGEWIKLPQ